MIKIKNALGILSSEMPTGNLLWVDQINGVDALAMRGRMTVPFKTLSAAKDAAIEGDTIIVLPGDYTTDTNLFVAGVNWHFLIGAKVTGEAGTDALFQVESAGLSRITGEGEFNSGGAGYVLFVDDPEANISFKGRKLEGVSASIRVDDCVSVEVTADELLAYGSPLDVRGGNVNVQARLIACEEFSAVYMAGGEVTLKADRVFSENAYGLLIVGGALTAHILEVLSDGGLGVGIDYGTALLTCMSIRSETGVAVQVNGGTLVIEGAKIYGSNPFEDAGVIILNTDGLTLRNCWIYANADESIMTSGGPQSCRVVSSIANVAVDLNTNQLTNSQLIVDSGITD